MQASSCVGVFGMNTAVVWLCCSHAAGVIEPRRLHFSLPECFKRLVRSQTNMSLLPPTQSDTERAEEPR